MPRAARKCILCKMTLDDPVKLGEFKTYKSISAHYYCLLLTTQLLQNGSDNQGILGFLPEDIRTEERRIRNQICFYCNKTSANLACCAPKCHRVFHLHCGLENLAICHFKDDYRTICSRHHTAERKKCTKKDDCVICCESMGGYNRVLSILAPCCRSGWFHKWCIAKFAVSSGYFFKCPLCNNRDVFRSRLVHKGIFVPDQDATWELEPNAFSDLLARPESCSAEACKCPRGRSYRCHPYQLCTCETCGSSAVHALCMEPGSQAYNCNSCVDILKSASPALPTPSPITPDDQNKSETEEPDVIVIEVEDDNKEWIDNTFDNDNDNDSVDSLLMEFVRHKDDKDEVQIVSCSSTDISGDSVLYNDRDTINSNYIGKYHQNEISDEDINLIYRSVRKRKCSLRRENSEIMAASPKRLKGSTSSVDSMLFDPAINISDSEAEKKEDVWSISTSDEPIQTKEAEDCSMDFTEKANPAAHAPLSKPLKPFNHSIGKSTPDSSTDIEIILSSDTSEEHRSRSRHKDRSKKSRKRDKSRSSKKAKDKGSQTYHQTIVQSDDDNNRVLNSSSTTKPRAAPIDTRRRSTRINALREFFTTELSTPIFSPAIPSTPSPSTVIPSTTATNRPSRIRSRAKSICVEMSKRKDFEDELTNDSSLKPKMRLRSKSVCAVRTEPLRRSSRLREKSMEKIYKEDLIYVTELQGNYFKRQPFSAKEILHLFAKRNSCDNRIRRSTYDETLKENMDAGSLKKRQRDLSVDSYDEFSTSSSMVMYDTISMVVSDPSMQSRSDASDSSMLNQSFDLESDVTTSPSCDIDSATMPQTFFEF